MSNIGTILLLLSSFVIIANCLTPISLLTNVDKDRLRTVFDSAFKKNNKDAKTVALALFGYSLLDRKCNFEKEACALFKEVYDNSEDLDQIYHSSFGASYISSDSCLLDGSKPKAVLSNIQKISNIEDLYKFVMAKKLLAHKNDAVEIGNLMDKLMKKDGGAVNQAHSYLIATEIYSLKNDLKKYWVEIEDTLQQADEADGTYLYYEGGLYTTAKIVSSILQLSDKYDETPPVSDEKIVKLANFLLSRRQTYNLAAAIQLTLALKSLSRNKYAVPIVVSATENGDIDKENAHLQLSVTNIWGDPITNVQVTAETIKNVHTGVTVITKKSAIQGALPGFYNLDLSSGKLDKGFYALKIEIKANDTRFSSVTHSNLVAKVTSDVKIENVEISIKERDQLTGATNFKLSEGSLLTEKLSINWHQRLEMKFTIKDDKQIFKPHQVFIKMTHTKMAQEIIFVAEMDKSESYKFILDLEKSNKDFDNLSGNYEMQLIVGDAVIKNPILWTFANIKLEMPSSSSTENVGDSRRSVAGMKKTAAVNPRVGQGPTEAKEQIFHVFRPADKRAGDFIAIVFTVLCTVPPMLIMFVMWAMVGINVSNFNISLSSATFHGGLTVIFGLYYCYWSYLDMFTTLRYLIPLGAVTAFFGNRVLRHVASLRQKL